MFPCTHISRRDVLRLGAGALAVAALPAPVRAAGATGRDDFTFAVLTDIHYRDARCGEWLERVTAHLRALRPRPAFIVLAGDLADAGTREQLGAVREIFRTLPMPVRSIIGNHDYTRDGSRQGWERLHGTRLNARWEHGGWQFLALDSTQGLSVYRTRIPGETLRWLDTTLPDVSRRRPVVVLTHFPLGRNWLRPLNAGAVLERLRGHDLRAAMSGHWHGLTERIDNGVPLTTGRCCSWWRGNHDGSDLKGYLLCRVRDGAVAHQFMAVT